jgi:hypothetical protein
MHLQMKENRNAQTVGREPYATAGRCAPSVFSSGGQNTGKETMKSEARFGCAYPERFRARIVGTVVRAVRASTLGNSPEVTGICAIRYRAHIEPEG